MGARYCSDPLSRQPLSGGWSDRSEFVPVHPEGETWSYLLAPLESGAHRFVEADCSWVGHDQHPVVQLRRLNDRMVPHYPAIPLPDQIAAHEHSQQLDVITPVTQFVKCDYLSVLLENEHGMVLGAILGFQLIGQTRIRFGMVLVVAPMPDPRQRH